MKCLADAILAHSASAFRAIRLVLVPTLLGFLVSGSFGQLIPGRLVSGAWEATPVHTDNRAPMPAFDTGISSNWGLTYVAIDVPGTGIMKLMGIRGVGGFNLDETGLPSDEFDIRVFSSSTAIIASPRVGDLYNGHHPITELVENWGGIIGTWSLRPAYKVGIFPLGGTSLSVTGGQRIYLSASMRHASVWTWSETDLGYTLGPDPVLLGYEPTTLILMTNPPFNYPYGVTALDVYFQYAGRTVSGTIQFSDLDTSAASPTSGTIDFEDTPGHIVVSRTATLDAAGHFSVPAPDGAGQYLVSIKHTHWLRRTVGPYDTTSDVSNVQLSLVNGDCDGDNEITLVDYGQLAASFGKALGDNGFNPNADLDGDLEVTLVDASILAAHFGEAGDD